MKAALALAALVVMFSAEVAAQNRQAAGEANAARVAGDVREASAAARVPVDQSGVAAFVSSAKMQGNPSRDVYRTVPSDVRVSRLSRYLSAKAATSSGMSSVVTPEDLPDFHWGYIATDVRYAPIKYQGATPASLLSIESGDSKYVFPATRDTRSYIQPGSAVLLPMSFNGSNEFTVTFAFDMGRGVWTGMAADGVMRVAASRDSRGCEIVVNSRPDKATVYFNGNQWRELTDTRPVIQEPGIWEILVKETRSQGLAGSAST
jgi:hypothetical protein